MAVPTTLLNKTNDLFILPGCTVSVIRELLLTPTLFWAKQLYVPLSVTLHCLITAGLPSSIVYWKKYANGIFTNVPGITSGGTVSFPSLVFPSVEVPYSNMTSFKRFESKPVVKIIFIYNRLNL
jgi:hypothetical protein